MGDGSRVSVAAGACLAGLVLATGIARAEFEIPQVDIEKGEVEIEYRGAEHWGLPPPEDDGEIDALRQSHEVEIQYGLTDYWAFRVTPNSEQPGGESLRFTTVGLETQFVLKPRHGGGFGLAIMAGYGPDSIFADLDDPDEAEFGPVIELAQGGWLLTLNPRLYRELGHNADQDGFGAEYASQLEFALTRRWSVAALMFGEIEELADSGGFSAQAHVLGPGLYLYSHNKGAPGQVPYDPDREEVEWVLGVAGLFGLTEASADSSLRVTFSVEFW